MIKKIKGIWASLDSKEKNYLSLALLLIGITGFFSIFVLPFIFTLNAPFKFMEYSASSNNVANTINGIATPFIAIASVIITFLAFWVQYQANIQQKKQFELSLNETRSNYSKERIENRFFELLRIHIANRNTVVEKAGDFQELVDKLQEIVFTLESIKSTLPTMLTEHQINNIAYALFFHGFYRESLTGNYTYQQTYKIFNKYIELKDDMSVSKFIEELGNRLKGSESNVSLKDYSGVYDTLGTYFRHLFQTVKYINGQPSPILSYKDKYGYIKILRAQLTDSEQLLFFYNAISKLGKPWELAEGLDANHRLITKYDLIKNIPVDILTYPKVKNYFPLVFFESDNQKSKKRRLLDKEFS